MEIFQLTSFLAQATPPAGQSQQSSMFPFIMMILMFVMMYFLLIRPQRKQQKEHQLRLKSLKIGDEVITNGGIHGVVSNVKDSVIKLKVADGVKLDLEKSAVASITKKSDKDDDDTASIEVAK
ncbi:MAG: preprotein translocase subunit YajC [Verrucomicrobiales bacterium]|jgi:preprotein translocase subunit YajC